MGATFSGDFPMMSPAQSAYGRRLGFEDQCGGLVAGSTRRISGEVNDVANSVAVDGAGEAFVTGNTASDNFPTVRLARLGMAEPRRFVAKVGRSSARR